jgi:peptidoglycan hydrolase-like protein with peptidoglycan-binding domain
MVKKLPELNKGDSGEHVETLQGLLLARSHPEVSMTGKFDDTTESAVKAMQRWGGVEDDGIVGPKTWPVLLRVH